MIVEHRVRIRNMSHMYASLTPPNGLQLRKQEKGNGNGKCVSTVWFAAWGIGMVAASE
jgi:hypothetical protein